MNELIIIGGGAAGLMAACAAGEAGLGCILLERRHRPGLKLLLCGNNRCNISHDADADGMIRDYGGKIGDFLAHALRAFPPASLRRWFENAGIPTVVKRERIYPKSENADDILHCFLDRLRELQVPLALNCPVADVAPLPEGGFQVTAENGVVLQARNVLIATGGVSFPKTGSVGDGQKMAAKLNHRVTPLRPGLAGMEISDDWLSGGHESDIPDAVVQVRTGDAVLSETRGNVLCSGNILRGSAIFDATRQIAHADATDCTLWLDLFPDESLQALERLLARAATPAQLNAILARQGIPAEIAAPLARLLGARRSPADQAAFLKHAPVHVLDIRPLKEAIVTAGGVALDQLNPATMESTLIPGLYFAGEVMDVDGPTGGYNLHAAFATARLAIAHIAASRPNVKAARDARPPRQEAKDAKPNSPRHTPPPPQHQSPKQRYAPPRSKRW